MSRGEDIERIIAAAHAQMGLMIDGYGGYGEIMAIVRGEPVMLKTSIPHTMQDGV